LAIKAKGSEIVVSDCKFRNIGGTVVRIEGGDRKLLIPARNVVERCDIGFYGRFKQTFQPAMGVYGCGNVVRNCKFHDGPYISLWYFGNEHLIANNEFTRVVLEAGDSSAVYSGRDASSWGNVFFGNNIHDLGMDSHLSEFRMGIYLDDCDCGDRIIGNTFRSCGHAVFIGGGNGNIVANNLMEDTPEAVHLDSRGMTWKLYTNLPDGRSWWHNCNKDFDYRMPPWSIVYPELPGLVDDNPNLPWMNTFKGNQIVRCKSGLGFKHKAKDVIDRMVIENNTIITNETKGVLPQKVNFSHVEKTVLRSPNGKIEADIELDVTGRLSWKMKVDGKEVVALSPLGITVDKRDYGRLVVPCKAKINQDEKALFATIPLKCLIAQDIVMYLDLRLTDKLLKWRWRAPEDGVYKVHGEFTRWNMIENAPLQLLHSDVPQGLSEGKYFVYEKNLWGVGNPFDLLPKEVKGNILSPWRITMIK
jgi:parallel beta-helix repeat protein